ncbi:MAG: nucleoside 2-deoxyribosyltransferase [Bradyrhizobium sp.]|uniref:PfkB family carbohydrate kinase n=1 Tax=Bradyrhizobium sp. TaxID=376 RepID=UPI001C28A479|nr:PfkB family carbohydrate kinase [Bradyrhizobium sp.]MBU6464008.1 nucleoside 2-deoxyribosyltransferase [Pseudomonadota bacterium]MDE2069027.1 nucleoside 2-deoxyribosyltransferase [Bradyrhizobium sp.]MDE2469347.1 nucleoside 2-deoxyribosyltransferase [Bradyrhizobium sp.]
MKAIDIVGGVYGEICSFPIRKQIFGSAGRAAVALSSPHFERVTLHTALSRGAASQALPNFDVYGIDVVVHGGAQFISFEYLHCLSIPLVQPAISNIAEQPPFHVQGELVVQFGMLECRPTIEADVCVYDPQSAVNPRPFSNGGSKANRLAFIANAHEVQLITGLSIEAGAARIIRDEKAEVVVVKCGLEGARMFDQNGFVGHVPAYLTKSVFTIGSGDIFVAAFALAWGKEKLDVMRAADYASKAVASYVETELLPIPTVAAAEQISRDPIKLARGKIYLAGPFRELGQRVMINEARKVLRDLEMQPFSPVHDIGHGPARSVVQRDLAAIKDCDAVFAILNGSSPGTLFEVGYASAMNKPIYCVAQNMRSSDIKLPEGAGCVIHEDFISALHLLAWRQ